MRGPGGFEAGQLSLHLLSVFRLWISRYKVEASAKILESEQVYQDTVDRLADVRRHESLCLLQKAQVQFICSVNDHMNSIYALCLSICPSGHMHPDLPFLSHHMVTTPSYTFVLQKRDTFLSLAQQKLSCPAKANPTVISTSL